MLFYKIYLALGTKYKDVLRRIRHTAHMIFTFMSTINFIFYDLLLNSELLANMNMYKCRYNEYLNTHINIHDN